MSLSVRRHLALLIAVVALGSLGAGCGSSSSGGSGSGEGGAVAGCLSPAEVSDEIERIAEGAEYSDEEVEAKQEAIRAVEAEAC
jgi:hypothetical protein